MTQKPKSDWTLHSTTVNSDFYRARNDLLVIIPHDDIRETEETARENLEAQAAFWKDMGQEGCVVIFMDPVLEQDAGARAVYAQESGNVGTRCFALIGESFFAMATSSVYTGLARPTVPTEVFRSLEDAQPWIDEMLKKDASS